MDAMAIGEIGANFRNWSSDIRLTTRTAIDVDALSAFWRGLNLRPSAARSTQVIPSKSWLPVATGRPVGAIEQWTSILQRTQLRFVPGGHPVVLRRARKDPVQGESLVVQRPGERIDANARPADAEVEFVVLAQSGDLSAFEELVRLHQVAAFRVALVLAPSPEDAEEAVQEGFIRAYRALARFRIGSPFRPWLLAIVANEARSKRRQAGRRVMLSERILELPVVDIERSSEEEAISRERAAQLLQMMDRLRPDDRLIIAYRYLLDMSEAEIAQALGIRGGTVKSRLSRAMGRLRQLFEGHAEDSEPTRGSDR